MKGSGRVLGAAGLAALLLLAGAPPARAQVPPAVTKVVVSGPGPYGPGDTIVFQIDVVNGVRQGEPMSVELTDYMSANWVDPTQPPSVVFNSDPASSCDPPVFESGGVGWRVTCRNPSIPVGGSWTIQLEVVADPTACLAAIQSPAIDPENNLLSWSWSTASGGGSDSTQVPIDFRAPACDFSVRKSAWPVDLRPGDPVTFRIDVENVGGTYHRYDGFFFTTVFFDVFPPAFEDVTLVSSPPDYECILDDSYDGQPPPGFAFLPAQPGTLLLCFSPARDGTWRFEAGDTREFEVSAELSPTWSQCGQIVNTAGFYFGYEVDAFVFRYGAVSSGDATVNVNLVCGGGSPPPSPTESPSPTDSPSPTGSPGPTDGPRPSQGPSAGPTATSRPLGDVGGGLANTGGAVGAQAVLLFLLLATGIGALLRAGSLRSGAARGSTSDRGASSEGRRP